MEIVERLMAGDERALARAISLVEERAPQARDILQEIFPRTGRARVVGVTGFPGGGKSSLVDRLTACYRSEGKTVGVVAVDPSSAFSGGAILGDRIRMQRHSADPGVYIRSMATRGALGGLSKAASDAMDILDASGRDVIMGVRPEDLQIANGSDPPELCFDTMVEVVERLGAEILLDLQVGEQMMVASVEPNVTSTS